MRSTVTDTLRTGTPLLLAAALVFAVPAASAMTPRAHPAKKITEVKPGVTTGGVRYRTTSSVQLTATIQPNGVQTTYNFEWGTASTNFTHHTTVTAVGNQITKIGVGQTITGLSPGVVYYYRAVAYAEGKKYNGATRNFALKGTALHFTVPKLINVPAGSPLNYSGTLGGLEAAGMTVALETTSYPYGEFTQLGETITTDSTGHFTFHIGDLAVNTELRVVTNGLKPTYSADTLARATARVWIRGRHDRASGLTRIYGHVSPAVNGSEIEIQQQKVLHSGRRAGKTVWVTDFRTRAKPDGKLSRYSTVVRINHTARYRAYARLAPGRISPGRSAWQRFVAAPRHHHHHRHH